MDFSEDDTFMQMSVQKINAEVVMDIGAYQQADDIYVVWNIQTNQMVTNFERTKRLNALFEIIVYRLWSSMYYYSMFQMDQVARRSWLVGQSS